ncbi:MAG TPA: sugar isomerase domain-containing protein [Acidobacteriaceae bacterium]|nr:sugar isomerase domain-containing protein [Acidobacteriaceae bacterium]
MSELEYLSRITEVIAKIRETQKDNIEKAAEAFAKSIQSGGRVYMFGSGHSVIPVLDIFPRYGSFVGFYPIYDPRLMWSNVVGPGGARELLWLEQREGYAKVVLSSYELKPVDSILIFSHGGLNAAPIEMGIEAKKSGVTVVSVSSHANYKHATAKHSTGKKLADASDIAIDNCIPPEDALVAGEGIPEKFAAGSTVASVSIAMTLVSETGKRLLKKGVRPNTFVSPNVGLSPDHNEQVFKEYTRNVLR